MLKAQDTGILSIGAALNISGNFMRYFAPFFKLNNRIGENREYFANSPFAESLCIPFLKWKLRTSCLRAFKRVRKTLLLIL
jgi:hypothetical protein